MNDKALKPVLVDETIYRAFAAKYIIYGVFGLAGALTSVPSVTEVAGELYATIWASLMSLLSFVVAWLAWGGKHERGELYATICLIGLILVYSISLILLALGGSSGRSALAVIATALLVFPIWRVRFLFRKLRHE